MAISPAQREFELYRKDTAEARAILDEYVGKEDNLSPEHQERFDKLTASAESHKKMADRIQAMDEAGKDVETRMTALIGGQTPDSTGTEDHRGFNAQIVSLMMDAKRSIRSGKDFSDAVEGVIDLEKRAIADFSDNGALYTTDFATTMAIYQRTVSPWINLASVINADNGRPLNLPNLTVDPSMTVPGEGTAITENSGTIGSAALTTTAYKTLSYVSSEAEEDELVGLLPIIARGQGRQLGFSFGTALTATVLTAATNGGTATGLGGGSTATFIGLEDLLTLKYGRAVPYRSAGSWVMANGLIVKARKWVDKNGQYLWGPSMAVGQPETFDGHPVFEDPGLATPASATKSVLFGDVSAVVIKQMPLRVAVSTEFRFNVDQVAIRSVYRAGGALPDAIALAYIVSANS